ncbi:MAG: hypothetical protein COA79_02255 [Planctomycetota bacterium]|nr:MAG: hypothetical protein COA79_02255 [Planctomycetota bacterium]
MKQFLLIIIVGFIFCSCTTSFIIIEDNLIIKNSKEALAKLKLISENTNRPITYEATFGIKFKLIPSGTYKIGSPEAEPGRQKKERPHLVTITKSFYISATEITQEQWSKIYLENPSKFKGLKLPVDHVTYGDSVKYCRRLSKHQELPFRLPTESEWEIACRGGSSNSFSGTGKIADMGWYNKNSNKSTHTVAQKKPNTFGLYDMHGNVWEWCSDISGEYNGYHLIDPKGAKNQSGNHVRRGGSYQTSSTICRSAYRNLYAPLVYRHRNTGFRIAIYADQIPRTAIKTKNK